MVKFFMENKKITIITILTVGILIIIFGGITYAFFTANNPEGSTAQIISDTGKMLISYDDGTDSIVPVKDIQPSNDILVNKTFTLTGTNTTVGTSSSDGLTMPYKVGLKYTSTFSNGMLHYYIKKVEDKSDADVTSNFVITPETDKTEADYINQTIPGNPTYTGYVHGTFKTGSNNTDLVSGEFPASKNDQKITFNLIIQFPDNNKNQDSEKGKTFNGKIVINYEPSFKDDSWEEIADNVKAGNGNLYKIGDEKEVKIGGTNYTVRVANTSIPDECNNSDFSETACGFVVEFVDIIDAKIMNSSATNEGGWEASEIREYLNDIFLESSLPGDIQQVITETRVISGHGTTAGEENFETYDKLYLLSPHEIYLNAGFREWDTDCDNTRPLDYYQIKQTSTSGNEGPATKTYNNSQFHYWLRTAYYFDPSDSFWAISGSGSLVTMVSSETIGLAPAFRIGE